ncbi:MAG: carbohydrate-binding domain-containing protein, partial [Oscillospiraceae bacterium]|nr:carbohydrate-binding domain-containing protein [Oscillospiraceae bacterium]
MKKTAAVILALIMLMGFSACALTEKNETLSADPASTADAQQSSSAADNGSSAADGAHVLTLSGDTAVLDGVAVEEFDYVWKTDPGKESEWYEGDEPETDAAVYAAHDIWYYPSLDESGFSKEVYDGETEWVYRYTAEGLTDYIFSTLPVLGTELPAEMMHTAQEAYENKVLHITKSGTYVLEGSWKGQIFVDLGDRDETFADESARVTLILNGVDVECSCAPAIIFYSAYECDNGWEDRDEYGPEVDTSNAGVNVVIADGTENSFTGANVFRLLKAKYKSDGAAVQKKAHKTDGAFYSFVSMNINGGENGTGILNIRSTTFEGLDSELHLTVNGGYINIYSQDDGINVNEDGVSVFTMNGGVLHIFAGLGAEGDGIDSNGYITVNGGLIAGGTPSGSDELLDSDCGNYENGGEVITVGSGQGMGFFGGGGFQPPDGAFPGGIFDPSEGFGGGTFTPPEGFGDGSFTPPGGFGGGASAPGGSTDAEALTPPEGFDAGALTPPEGFDAGALT